MSAFLSAHGGVIASVLLVLGLYNVIMSGIAQIFALLKASEPGWLQTAGAWGLKITQWLSANTPTPAATPTVATKT